MVPNDDNSKISLNCNSNFSCEFEEWLNSYHVVSNGRIIDTPRPFVDSGSLTKFVFDPDLATRSIENAIHKMYENQTVDLFLNCNKSFTNNPTQEFYIRFLTKMHLSTGLENLGGFNFEMIFCLFLVFITVYFALWKGIKSAGKVLDFSISNRISNY